MPKASEGEVLPGGESSGHTQTPADANKEEGRSEPTAKSEKIAAIRMKVVSGLFLLVAVPVGLLLFTILLDVVILPAGRFLKAAVLDSYPLNLWFAGAAIAWMILAGIPARDRWWAKFLRAPLAPAIVGLGLLMLFVGVLWELRGGDANLFANWEDRIILTLNDWLGKHPSTWEYVIALSLAALVSCGAPQWKAVTRVKSVKKWRGTVAGIVAVMANVTFLGEQQVVKTRYPEVVKSLQARYVKAEKRKREHLQLEFAWKATTKIVRERPQTLRDYVGALAALDLPESYQKRVGDSFMPEAETGANDSEASRDGRKLETKSETEATKLEPEKLVAAVNQEATQEQVADRQTDRAQDGLKTALKEIVASQNGKLVDLSMNFLDPVVQQISEHAGVFLDTIFESLQDQAKSTVEDLIKEYEGKYVDQELARFNRLPAPAVTREKAGANLMARAVDIAASDLNDLVQRTREIAADAQTAKTDDELSRVTSELAGARQEKEDAQKVLKTCAGAVSQQGGPVPVNFDEVELKEAERSMSQIESQRSEAERQVSRAKQEIERGKPHGLE